MRGLPAQVDIILRDLNLLKNRMDLVEDRLSSLEQSDSSGGPGGGGGQSGATAKRTADQKRKRAAAITLVAGNGVEEMPRMCVGGTGG